MANAGAGMDVGGRIHVCELGDSSTQRKFKGQAAKVQKTSKSPQALADEMAKCYPNLSQRNRIQTFVDELDDECHIASERKRKESNLQAFIAEHIDGPVQDEQDSIGG